MKARVDARRAARAGRGAGRVDVPLGDSARWGRAVRPAARGAHVGAAGSPRREERSVETGCRHVPIGTRAIPQIIQTFEIIPLGDRERTGKGRGSADVVDWLKAARWLSGATARCAAGAAERSPSRTAASSVSVRAAAFFRPRFCRCREARNPGRHAGARGKRCPRQLVKSHPVIGEQLSLEAAVTLAPPPPSSAPGPPAPCLDRSRSSSRCATTRSPATGTAPLAHFTACCARHGVEVLDAQTAHVIALLRR